MQQSPAIASSSPNASLEAPTGAACAPAAAVEASGGSSLPPAEITAEGRSALKLDAAMALRLEEAKRLSRSENNHKDAADILGDLLQAACV